MSDSGTHYVDFTIGVSNIKNGAGICDCPHAIADATTNHALHVRVVVCTLSGNCVGDCNSTGHRKLTVLNSSGSGSQSVGMSRHDYTAIDRTPTIGDRYASCEIAAGTG